MKDKDKSDNEIFMKTNSGQEVYTNEPSVRPNKAQGIVVSIQINCETEDELLIHLSVVRSDIKKLLKLNQWEIRNHHWWEDNNCYGSHDVDIDLQ